MRTVIHAVWRIGLVAAALGAAAVPANAQDPSPLLGLTPYNPHIGFNGSSRSTVSLDAGNLKIAAGATFVTTVNGQDLLILTKWNVRELDVNGRCDSFNVGDPQNPDVNTEYWLYATDQNGANPKCYSDLYRPGTLGGTTTPPGTHGYFNAQARVDVDGSLLGGTPAGGTDACGAQNGDDLCVQGLAVKCVSAADANACWGQGGDGKWQIVEEGILLTGKVTNSIVQGGFFSSMRHDVIGNGSGFDLFELVFQVSGGALAATYPTWSDTAPIDTRQFVTMIAGGIPNGASPFVDFNTPFSESVIGSVYAVRSGNAMMPPADPCNGRISGSVTDYFNALVGIPGAEVSLTGKPNLIPAANGAYSTGNNLCTGTYTVTALPPGGYAVYGAGSQQIVVSTSVDGTQNTVAVANFRMYAAAVNSASFTTFVQAAWGTKPKANNAGALLATYFGLIYSSGELVLGDVNKFTITETGSSGVQDFLPQEGRPAPLTASYIDPPSRWKPQHAKKQSHHRRLGSLAGETLALELNVRFSAYALTRFGLGSLKVASGKLAGMTVDQVLALANSVLGGNALPSGLKYDDIEDVVERINKNFQAGTTNNGYLIVP